MQTATENKKVKFATQADPEVLTALRKIAGDEGRQLQALVDEALRELEAQGWVEAKPSSGFAVSQAPREPSSRLAAVGQGGDLLRRLDAKALAG